MPTNLPEIQQLLADWLILIQSNPLFVGALTVAVWILAAIIYNFKILFLKKKQKAQQQSHLELENKLKTAEQQLQQQEEKLTANSEQTANDKQLVADSQAKLKQRNQAIVENIRAIAGKHDLSEQLIGTAEEMKGEFIWQQQDNMVQQLSDRLGLIQHEKETLEAAHQKEIAQVSQKDSVITSLQNSVEEQTKKFTQLEQAIEKQKLVQEQQQKEVQQQLCNTLEKHQLDFAQLINAVQKGNPLADEGVQEKNAPEELVQQEEPVQQQEVKPEKNVESQHAELSTVENVGIMSFDDIETTAEDAEPVSDVDNRIEQADKAEAITPVQTNSEVQGLLDIAEPTFSTLEKNEFNQAAPVSEEVAPDHSTSKKNVAGRFKSLLGKVKKPKAEVPKVEQKNAVSTREDLNVTAAKEATTGAGSTESDLNVSGKFKKLMGKVKKPKVEAEAEQQIESFIADDLSVSEAEEAVAAEPDYAASKIKVPGAFKKLFGKTKT